jgi:hypothetical protein
MMSRLKPDDREIAALARREARMQSSRNFRPICAGFWGNASVLMCVGLLAAAWLPLRLLVSYFRTTRN